MKLSLSLSPFFPLLGPSPRPLSLPPSAAFSSPLFPFPSPSVLLFSNSFLSLLLILPLFYFHLSFTLLLFLSLSPLSANIYVFLSLFFHSQFALFLFFSFCFPSSFSMVLISFHSVLFLSSFILPTLYLSLYTFPEVFHLKNPSLSSITLSIHSLIPTKWYFNVSILSPSCS